MATSTRKAIRKLRREKEAWFHKIARLDVNSDELKNTQRNFFAIRQELEGLETDDLINKVYKLGIQLPDKQEGWWWDDLDWVGPDDFRKYLTPKGQGYVWKLIRDERKKNIEWWVKTLGSLIPMLTALAGTIVAILALLSR